MEYFLLMPCCMVVGDGRGVLKCLNYSVEMKVMKWLCFKFIFLLLCTCTCCGDGS